MADNAQTSRHSGGTVCIGCKLPAGLILELDNITTVATPMSGGREVPVHAPSGKKFEIIGSKANEENSPQHRLLEEGTARVAFGYGMTDIPADFWEAWSTQHKGFPPLELGQIFAVQNSRDAAGEAKNRKALKTGLEGMDPDKPAPGIARETGKNI